MNTSTARLIRKYAQKTEKNYTELKREWARLSHIVRAVRRREYARAVDATGVK